LSSSSRIVLSSTAVEAFMRDSFKYLGSEWFLYVTTIGDRDGSLFTGLTMRHEPRDEDCQFS